MMHITREEVVLGYRHILGRVPDAGVIDNATKRFKTVWELVRVLMASQEFRNKSGQATIEYRGYDPEDIVLLKKFAFPVGPTYGFITDFLGVKTCVSFTRRLAQFNGVVEGLPVPKNFRAETIEWVAVLKAVDEAKDSFAVAEIGAGFGAWVVVALVAAKRKSLNTFAVAVEADDGHCTFLRQHLRDNGLDEDSNFRLLKGAASSADGTAYFPLIESKFDYGAAAVPSNEMVLSEGVDYRNRKVKYLEKSAFSLGTILQDRETFDLVHIDVQGSEREIIPASLEALQNKVKRIVIGTHSRSIEGQLFDTLSSSGWLLEREKPCKFSLKHGNEAIREKHTDLDGTQVWVNPRFAK